MTNYEKYFGSKEKALATLSGFIFGKLYREIEQSQDNTMKSLCISDGTIYGPVLDNLNAWNEWLNKECK